MTAATGCWGAVKLVTAVAQLRLAFALLRGHSVPAWALSSLVSAGVAIPQEFGNLSHVSAIDRKLEEFRSELHESSTHFR